MNKINLFIDTNIWLNLYQEGHEVLDKILEEKLIKILIPEQVKHEVVRNRKGKIDEITKTNRVISSIENLNGDFPKIYYAEYKGDCEEFNKMQQALLIKYNTIKNNITKKIEDEDLEIDKKIKDIFKNKIETTDDILKKANYRKDIGNPPSNKGNTNICDAIIWETLLSNINNKEDLHFITEDGDFIDNKEFLKKEYEEKNGGKLYFYETITNFIKSNQDKIKIKKEIKELIEGFTNDRKIQLIQELKISSTFLETHSIIKILNSGKFIFSEYDKDNLCDIATNNTQVNWILTDKDVWSFYKNLIINEAYRPYDCSLNKIKDIIEKQ